MDKYSFLIILNVKFKYGTFERPLLWPFFNFYSGRCLCIILLNHRLLCKRWFVFISLVYKLWGLVLVDCIEIEVLKWRSSGFRNSQVRVPSREIDVFIFLFFSKRSVEMDLLLYRLTRRVVLWLVLTWEEVNFLLVWHFPKRKKGINSSVLFS